MQMNKFSALHDLPVNFTILYVWSCMCGCVAQIQHYFQQFFSHMIVYWLQQAAQCSLSLFGY